MNPWVGYSCWMSRRRVSGYGSRKSVGFGQIRKFSPIFFKIPQETGYFCMVPPKSLPFYSILEPVNGLSCRSNDFFTDIVVIKFLVIIL